MVMCIESERLLHPNANPSQTGWAVCLWRRRWVLLERGRPARTAPRPSAVFKKTTRPYFALRGHLRARRRRSHNAVSGLLALDVIIAFPKYSGSPTINV